jgi:hypothetical protein
VRENLAAADGVRLPRLAAEPAARAKGEAAGLALGSRRGLGLAAAASKGTEPHHTFFIISSSR